MLAARLCLLSLLVSVAAHAQDAVTIVSEQESTAMLALLIGQQAVPDAEIDKLRRSGVLAPYTVYADGFPLAEYRAIAKHRIVGLRSIGCKVPLIVERFEKAGLEYDARTIILVVRILDHIDREVAAMIGTK